MRNPELLPCPFCGSTNIRYYRFEYMSCCDCRTDGPRVMSVPGVEMNFGLASVKETKEYYQRLENLVREAWNKRA